MPSNDVDGSLPVDPSSESPAANAEVYPWEVSPALMQKFMSYAESGEGVSYKCSCNELLNTLEKEDAVGPGEKAELVVCSDLVACTGRAGRLGCLGLLLALPALLLAGPSAFLLAIPGFILRLILYPFALLFAFLQKKKLDYIARRIRENPKSAWAIKKMLELADLLPRIWQRGDVVQLIRVDAKRFLCGTRSLILFVQDTPHPKKVGCAERLLPTVFTRRRVYFVWLDKGRGEADNAAEAAARVLGLEVTKATYEQKRLVLS